MRQTKESINGLRKLPQGKIILSNILNSFNSVSNYAKIMQEQDKEGNTYSISGVNGAYSIIKYAPTLAVDLSYIR